MQTIDTLINIKIQFFGSKAQYLGPLGFAPSTWRSTGSYQDLHVSSLGISKASLSGTSAKRTGLLKAHVHDIQP